MLVFDAPNGAPRFLVRTTTKGSKTHSCQDSRFNAHIVPVPAQADKGRLARAAGVPRRPSKCVLRQSTLRSVSPKVGCQNRARPSKYPGSFRINNSPLTATAGSTTAREQVVCIAKLNVSVLQLATPDSSSRRRRLSTTSDALTRMVTATAQGGCGTLRGGCVSYHACRY